MKYTEPELMERAVGAVEAASELLSGGAIHEIRSKSPTDFVTDVDFAVQERLKRELAELAPEVQFMGEEQDNSAIDPARPFWVLDPVDGTTNLIRGLGRSAVSLALCLGDGALFGVVRNPFRRETFTARFGGGAYMNGEPIRVSATAPLAKALFNAGTAPGRRDMSAAVFRELGALYEHCVDLRRSGCASLDLCDVACGRLDGYLERWLLPWDYAAGMLIVSEAGGKATDCSGAKLPLTQGSPLLATNGIIHAETLKLLSEV